MENWTGQGFGLYAYEGRAVDPVFRAYLQTSQQRIRGGK